MVNLQQEFPQSAAICYLNHAAVAPWPARTRTAVNDFAEENVLYGAQHYPNWMATETTLRKQLAQLINAAHSDDIALLKNTSEGLSFIASGLDWRAGDEIVISNQEFPSNRIPWQALSERGVRVIEVDLDSADPEQALIDAFSPRTRLLSISSIQFGSGLRIDLERLGAACQQADVLFCVDAIQSLGAVAFDVQQCQADFVVADGHKWMLGPEGLALFWVRPTLRDQLTLNEYGWHMVEHPGNYETSQWQPASSAKRFECGSPNMLCAHALSASLSLLLEVGMEQVETQLAERSAYLTDHINAHQQLRLISPADASRRGGIITFAHQQQPNQPLFQQLQNNGVICAQRGGGIRFSAHFYTPFEVIERALAVLQAAL